MADAASSVGMDEDAAQGASADICDAYVQAFSDTVTAEVERMARAALV